MEKYEVELVEDGDDLILPLPDELLEEMGWTEGDELEWELTDDGQVILKLSRQLSLF